MGYTNSKLVSYVKLSPNNSGNRKYPITRITPHCVVGQLSVETLGTIFEKPSRKASCNYGIGSDGRIGMYCEEKNRSWCSSNADNDNRAVTIECASDNTHPYTFNNTVYNRLIDLCVDICKRNCKNKLLWFNDKNKSLSYNPAPNEMIITVHRWFSKKACPGDWLMNHMNDLVNKVNSRLNPNQQTQSNNTIPYLVRIKEDLNVRKEPNANSQIMMILKKGSVYTIVKEIKNKNGSIWGELKSGVGYINLKFTEVKR